MLGFERLFEDKPPNNPPIRTKWCPKTVMSLQPFTGGLIVSTNRGQVRCWRCRSRNTAFLAVRLPDRKLSDRLPKSTAGLRPQSSHTPVCPTCAIQYHLFIYANDLPHPRGWCQASHIHKRSAAGKLDLSNSLFFHQPTRVWRRRHICKAPLLIHVPTA